jgi:hypothetical protein
LRPRSWRVFFSCFNNIFSTTDCVAIPAWSMPMHVVADIFQGIAFV